MARDSLIDRRSLLRGAAAVAAVGTASTRAVAAAPRPGPHRRDGTPRILIPSGVRHLDPTTGDAAGGDRVCALVYGQLFKWARPRPGHRGELRTEPYVAASTELVDDVTVVARLRRNVRFHDVDPVGGRLLTPDDVVATWERIVELQSSAGADRPGPETVPVVLDDRSVRFDLREPYAPLFSHFADVTRSILAREAIARGSAFLQQQPIGTGPFRLAKNDAGVEVVLYANPIPWWRPWDAREAAPYFDGLVMPIVPYDAAKQSEALLNGQLDYGTVQRADWETVEDDERFASTRFASHEFSYMRINHPLVPMDDVRVRQALSIGFSRGLIARSAFDGGARRTGPIPVSRMPWGLPTRRVPFHSYRPEQAKQLLAAAGFGDGLTLVNLLPAEAGFHNTLATRVARQLSKIGVTLEHDAQEYGAYLEKARLARTDPVGAGWHTNIHIGNRYDDIDGYLREYETFSGRNYGHWGDSETDAMIAEARGEYDLAARVALVHEIQRRIAENGWTPGLLVPVAMEAWSAQLEHMATGPEPLQGTRSFIDGSFKDDGRIY